MASGMTMQTFIKFIHAHLNIFGYDISDYRQIHEEYGTLADFDELLAECKRIGIRLILDFVPNHSSSGNTYGEILKLIQSQILQFHPPIGCLFSDIVHGDGHLFDSKCTITCSNIDNLI
jgi:Alpha amylase, catalytic domain